MACVCEACLAKNHGRPHATHAHCRLSDVKKSRQRVLRPGTIGRGFRKVETQSHPHSKFYTEWTRSKRHICRHSLDAAVPHPHDYRAENDYAHEPVHSIDRHTASQPDRSKSGAQCCSPHSHAPRNKSLEQILQALGILQVAEFLEEKVWVSVTITLLLAAAAILGWTQSTGTAVHVAQQASIAGIYLLAGIPEVVELMFNVLNWHFDTHVLMTLACFGTLAIGSGFEGSLLLVLFNVSHTVEHVLADKAQGSLHNLFDKIPQEATVVSLDKSGAPEIGNARVMPTSDVRVGSTILVRPGQQVPLDGHIVYGEALVSTEHITGEALPVRRTRGENVLAAALNHDGVLVVKSTKISSESTPARIAKLTEEAQGRRPQLHRWLDEFSEVYVKSVLAATGLSFIGLRLMGVPVMSNASSRGALYRAIGLLTTASPCALVLVPLAYVAALAAITKRGVLMRGSSILDALAQSSTIAFDKTGTLTTGQLSCSGIQTPGGESSLSIEDIKEKGSSEDMQALASVVALSQRASHPVSKAAASLGGLLNLPSRDVSDFKAVPGRGVQGYYEGAHSRRHIRFGSASYASEVLELEERSQVQSNASDLANENVVSVLVDVPDRSGQNGASSLQDNEEITSHIVRLVTFRDTVHPASKAAVMELQDGIRTSKSKNFKFSTQMLTGDGEASASRIAGVLGINNVQAQLSPEKKLEMIEQVRAKKLEQSLPSGVIMVGDGINDAPALAAADVGVAVASNPMEAASLVADIVLLRGDGVSALPYILKVAHQAQNIIKQNLVLAMTAILALSLPVLSGLIPLWVAVTLHEGSTLLVALNSLRVLYSRYDSPLLGMKSHSQGNSQGVIA